MNTTHLGGPTVPPPEPHPEYEPHLTPFNTFNTSLGKSAVMVDNAHPTPEPRVAFSGAFVLKLALATAIAAGSLGYYAGVNTKQVQFIERLHADPAQVVLL